MLFKSKNFSYFFLLFYFYSHDTFQKSNRIIEEIQLYFKKLSILKTSEVFANLLLYILKIFFLLFLVGNRTNKIKENIRK